MAFTMPPANHKARELFGSDEYIAHILDSPRLLCLAGAIAHAEKIAQVNGLSHCGIIAIMDNGDRVLIAVNKKGDYDEVWNFGKPDRDERRP